MSKKSRRRKQDNAPSIDANERRRQRLEARRQARAQEIARRQRVARRRRATRYALIAGLVAVGLWLLVARAGGPTEIDGRAIETVGMTGRGEHTLGQVRYESTPPVSGQHSPSAAPCGVHGEQIRDEQQVHTLEHGAVGIQYRPDLDPRVIANIETLVRSYRSHVFSAPYGGLQPPIAVSSWGRLMRLESFDEDAIREYLEEFREKGPERQPCPLTQNQPFAPARSRTPGRAGQPSPGAG